MAGGAGGRAGRAAADGGRKATRHTAAGQGGAPVFLASIPYIYSSIFRNRGHFDENVLIA